MSAAHAIRCGDLGKARDKTKSHLPAHLGAQTVHHDEGGGRAGCGTDDSWGSVGFSDRLWRRDGGIPGLKALVSVTANEARA
jgi:hypothetical protein